MPDSNSRRSTSKRSLVLIIPLILSIFIFVTVASAAVEQQPTEATGAKLYGLIAASLAVGLSGIGAGVAIFGSTSAGMAATAERPELATWVLILAGLGEGLAIYGLVVAIMILGKI
ncbi:MAG: ATP synthase subunit C [Candidatus Bathyarchaeia archaeon]|nr:hypothetical protein [Candidatus Bathyarchaeota archaeon]